jgi:hypothetical protein
LPRKLKRRADASGTSNSAAPEHIRPGLNRFASVTVAVHHIATIDLTNREPVGHVSEQVSVMSPD